MNGRMRRVCQPLPSLPLTASHCHHCQSLPPLPPLPSLPALSAFLLSHFAQLSPLAAAAEAPWLYHSPLPVRRRQKSTEPGVQPQRQLLRPLPSHTGVRKPVLSITPTEGVYAASEPRHFHLRSTIRRAMGSRILHLL